MPKAYKPKITILAVQTLSRLDSVTYSRFQSYLELHVKLL